jgi:excinuclease UvrABC nuclease subunit
VPFTNTTAYNFNATTIGTVNSVGGIYGLSTPMVNKPGYHEILYVGKAADLRERLSQWLKNPPGTGITHFFAEVISGEAARTLREAQLIKEFQPRYNTLLK